MKKKEGCLVSLVLWPFRAIGGLIAKGLLGCIITLVILVLGILVCGGLGFAAYQFFAPAPAPPAEASSTATALPPQPTHTPLPTQVPPTPIPPVPTLLPTATLPPPASVPANDDTAHWDRLRELDPVFRSSGMEAWLRAAGLSWTSLDADARQVEEETSPQSEIFVSGLQVDVVGLEVQWPNCATTDDPSEINTGSNSRQHQPDLRNPSVLYTNVTATGTVTVWTDCSNWNQLQP